MSAINFPLTTDISSAANQVSSQNAEQLPAGGSGQSTVLRPDTVTLSAVFPPAPPVDAANFVQFQSPAQPALELSARSVSSRELAGTAHVRVGCGDNSCDSAYAQSAGAASAAQPSARTAWHQSSKHQSRQSPCADQIGERSSGALESGSHARRARRSHEWRSQRA